MSFALLFKNLIAAMLLPPTNGLLLAALAGIFRRRRWAFWLAVFSFVLIGVQGMKPVADLLLAPLESAAGPVMTGAREARAIVVLAGGRERSAPEYGGETVSAISLERLRYGAVLARRHGLPVLVSGGSPGGDATSEAELMIGVLEKELRVPVRWREDASDDTAENATKSAALLRQAGIRRVVLVTHAFHMLRARRAFEGAGVEVVPAPMGFRALPRGFPEAPHEWLPRASAMRLTYLAMHEWIGLAWYALSAGW